jgi:curved DNA-binding protein CbpA
MMSSDQSSDQAGRAAIKTWIDHEYEELPRTSYYQLLAVTRDATEEQVRQAYYRLVARFHPDLYGDTLAVDTRAKLVSIYSRLVEAYRCLSSGERRMRYDKGLANGKLRWTSDDEHARGRDDADAGIANPKAKQFFRMGRAAIQKGDGKGAVTHLKLALSLEPQNQTLLAELARAEALTKGT